MSDASISLLILAGSVGLFVWNRLSVGVVAVLTSMSLLATGVLDADQALSGFGDPIVIFIASLFVVSEAIDSTGATTWAGQALIDKAGSDRSRLLTAVLVLCALLSAVLSPNGSVAALLPMVVVLALRIGEPPSHLLMPLAFTGSAGALLALSGSPVNVIVNDASQDVGAGGFGYFEFALVGVPLVLGTIAISVWLGPRVLPHRTSRDIPADLSQHAATLAQHYSLEDGFYRLRVRQASPLVGLPSQTLELADYPELTLIGVQRGRSGILPLTPGQSLSADDVLVVRGPAEQISRLVVAAGLAVRMRPLDDGSDGLLTRECGVVEVVIPPRSDFVGATVFPGFAPDHDLVLLAIRRRGHTLSAAEAEIEEGDSLLLHGTWEAITRSIDERDVLVVDSPDLIRRQGAPLSGSARASLLILAGMVAALVAGVLPAVAGLVAATAMVGFGVLTAPQAYRAVSWQTVVLIGGLIPLSTAIQTSGAADQIADVLLAVVGDGSPTLLLFAIFALTVCLGQFVSNAATVLIIVPVALVAAESAGISVQPVLMLVAVAGAASFLTPVATPANMMVMGPGGYQFGDYWRLGLPLLAWWLLVGVGLVPLIWTL